MSRTIYFISHPDVEISATVPVTQWPLSAVGRTRMKRLMQHSWVKNVTAVYCSTEQKAIDGADILGDHLSLEFTMNSALGENDRSATGYLESAEFERAADDFFSMPDQSFRGWETAQSAQNRIVKAVHDIDCNDNTSGDIAIVSHGAVGSLLYCHFANKTIDRRWDQPGVGGGNFIELVLRPAISVSWWKTID